MDKERLTKLMMMTTSTSDAEVLVAIRKANELLARSRLSWAEVLSGIAPRTSAPPPRTPSPTWEAPSARDEFAEFTRGPPHMRTSDKAFRAPPGVSPQDVDRIFVLALRRTKGTRFGNVVRGIKSWWDRERSLSQKQWETIRKAAS